MGLTKGQWREIKRLREEQEAVIEQFSKESFNQLLKQLFKEQKPMEKEYRLKKDFMMFTGPWEVKIKIDLNSDLAITRGYEKPGSATLLIRLNHESQFQRLISEGWIEEVKPEKKITQEHLESLIATQDYGKVGNKTTICCITLKNGFEVIGTSACVNPKDYDFEIGKKYAREKAIDKLWELEGYLQQNKMIE